MNLRRRIVTSLIILILLPAVMILIGMMCMFAYQDNYSQQEYGIGTSLTEAISNPVRVLDKLTSSTYQEILQVSKDEPDKLLDKSYLQSLNGNVDSKYAFIVVRINERFIYEGNVDEFRKLDCTFPEYGQQLADNQLMYISSDTPVLVKQVDFETSDDRQGSAFIVINMDNIIPQIRSMAMQLIFQLIVMVVCTAIVLIMWLYKSMLQPLNALSKAAKRISDGDLNFEIKDFTNDEIGTLCEDFEFMRQRLKENIDKQQNYEEESRILISNISHDLKTPLTAIKGYSEGLMDGVASTAEKQKKYLSTIYKKADDMTILVDELSLYAKIGMDAIPYNFVKININEYFNDCVDEIKNETELQNIKIGYFNYVDPKTSVVADPEQIKRVIDNIISNAIKYIDKTPGHIDIRVNEDEEQVIASFEDNGRGIAKEDIDKIFDRFYRTDASRNSKKGGTGLGLAISKKIMEDHGGSIYAKSTEGVGTEIIFTLKKKEENKDEK